MSGASNIEWTDATWNPIVGCSIVSAQAPEHILLAPLHWKKPRRVFVNSMGDLFHESVPDEWIDRVFAVMALCPQHTFQVLTKRAERMRSYVDQIGWQDSYGSLTECIVRLGREHGYPPGGVLQSWPVPNVWLGVSCERQQEADERIPHLLQTPAAIRFISAEPLLGPIDLNRIHQEFDGGLLIPLVLAATGRWRTFLGHSWESCLNGKRFSPWGGVDGNGGDIDGCEKLDWVIAGGESGSNARPMHPQWALELRDQCTAAGVPFFFKQWGEFAPVPLPDTHPRLEQTMGFGRRRFPFRQFMDIAMVQFGKKRAGRKLDGREWNEFPELRP